MHLEKYGEIRPDPELTRKTYKELNRGLGFKFGGDAGPDPAVLHMQRSLFRFSGAKSAAQAVELNDALHKDGKVVPWEDFKAAALGINEKYNKNHLQAEYQTAVQAGHHARNWQKYQDQKHLFPNLKYKTAGDSRVRPEHQALDGKIAPIDSDFWARYYPPNGWRCRCYVVQTAEPASEYVPDEVPDVPPEFRTNVGATLQIFPDGNKQPGEPAVKPHPYFAVAKSAGALKAIDKLADKQLHSEVKAWAKEKLVPESVKASGVGEVTFTMSGIKEALNQPHKDKFEKNIAIYNIRELIEKGKMVKTERDAKGRDFIWHYLETSINNSTSYIVLREDMHSGIINFYSIVDKIK